MGDQGLRYHCTAPRVKRHAPCISAPHSPPGPSPACSRQHLGGAWRAIILKISIHRRRYFWNIKYFSCLMTHAQWECFPLCNAAATYCNAPNNEILCKQSPAIKLPRFRYRTGNRKARAISTLLDNPGQDGINVFLTQDKWNPVVKFRVQSRSSKLWFLVQSR